jgi:hypothetical protein
VSGGGPSVPESGGGESVNTSGGDESVPASVGGGVMGGVQVPLVDPTAMWHVPPGQQSASVVQGPLMGMHVSQLHLSAPDPSGTHGLPPQQSSESAHAAPQGKHPSEAWQRGTPSGSRSQFDFDPR